MTYSARLPSVKQHSPRQNTPTLIARFTFETDKDPESSHNHVTTKSQPLFVTYLVFHKTKKHKSTRAINETEMSETNSVPVCVYLCTSRCDFRKCALRWVSPSQVLVFGEASGLRTCASRFCFGAVQTQFECWDVQPLPWHLETEKSQSLIRILNCFSQAKSSSRFVKFVEIFTRSSTLPSVDPV